MLDRVWKANTIANEFRRDEIRFSPNIFYKLDDFSDDPPEGVCMVRVDNSAEGYFYMWDNNKFANRLEMMDPFV